MLYSIWYIEYGILSGFEDCFTKDRSGVCGNSHYYLILTSLYLYLQYRPRFVQSNFSMTTLQQYLQ